MASTSSWTVFLLEFFLSDRRFYGKEADQLQFESFKISTLVKIAYDAFGHIEHHVCNVEANSFSIQGVLPALIDHLPLGIHHVIILKQVLPDPEVVLLHLFLSPSRWTW